MPFVSNTTAFVVGDVPKKDLERLNGNREERSGRAKFLVPVAAIAAIVCATLIMGFQLLGDPWSYVVFGVIAFSSYFHETIWGFIDPRVKSRKAWKHYAYHGQLYHESYLGFKLVMAPVVVANIHACEKEAGEFLKWYALQGFGVFGPIRRDEQPALGELRYKLESSVGEALRSVGESFPSDHVDTVLAPCRSGYYNELVSTEMGTEARIRDLQEKLEAARISHDNAAEERAYQQGMLKAPSA